MAGWQVPQRVARVHGKTMQILQWISACLRDFLSIILNWRLCILGPPVKPSIWPRDSLSAGGTWPSHTHMGLSEPKSFAASFSRASLLDHSRGIMLHVWIGSLHIFIKHHNICLNAVDGGGWLVQIKRRRCWGGCLWWPLSTWLSCECSWWTGLGHDSAALHSWHPSTTRKGSRSRLIMAT